MLRKKRICNIPQACPQSSTPNTKSNLRIKCIANENWLLNPRPPTSRPPPLDLDHYLENSAQPTLGTSGLGGHTPRHEASSSNSLTRIADWKTYPAQQCGVGSDDAQISENESLQNSVSNTRSGGGGPGPCDGNSPQLAPETNGRVRHTLKRGSPPLSPIRPRRESGTGKPTLPGKAGSSQTVRKLRRVGSSRILRPTPRVEEGSLTINLMKNPNTRQNSNAGWNPNQNPNASSNPNQNPNAISNPNLNPNAGRKTRTGGNPNAAGNTNIRRNPMAGGIETSAEIQTC